MSSASSSGVADARLGHLLRDLAPQVLGAVARRHDDFAAAEDAVQEALIAAAAQWPMEGIPTNPRGWLYQVAVRRLTDEIRRDLARRRREEAIASERSRVPSVAARHSAQISVIGTRASGDLSSKSVSPSARSRSRVSSRG